jgi:copper chaperone CopZ
MEQDYSISGMTCNSCVARVKESLESVPGVIHAEVSLQPPRARITSKLPISTQTFRNVLSAKGNYDASLMIETDPSPTPEETPSDTTFKPLLIIGAYLVLIATLLSYPAFSMHTWMRIFMAGFFFTFSFFKMLDLKSFVSSYKMYDLPAKYIPGYAWLYPFIELKLAILYAVNAFPVLTSAFTLTLMSVSIVGVIQSVSNKKKIRCACLGSVFNLPMTTVTIVEDSLMILMSAWMLFF